MRPLTANEVEQSVPARFYEVAAQHGERPAIQTQTDTITYDQLNRESNRIAHLLLEMLGPGNEAVCLLFEHGASAITAILGALKAGKIYVPLNTFAPLARNAQILAHSEARVLLTNSVNLESARLLADSARRLEVINIDTLPGGLHEDNPTLIVNPDYGSYLVYTSGSTGTPKGILNNHRNILHSVSLETATTGPTFEDRVALLYAYHFGAFRTTTFSALMLGSAIHPYDIKREGLHNLFQWLAGQQITILSALPTVFRHLVEQADSQPPLPHLRNMALGGEAVTRRDVELFRKHFPADCRLVNRFAATEGGRIAEFVVEPTEQIDSNIVPIGYPTAGKKVTITDADGNPVGIGVEGEITIQSRYLSPGYWRNPELTERAFRPAPDGSGERIYKTGDLGLMRADGCLMYRGRKDFQVKIRGQRVEIAEVELALLEQPDVKEAVVVAQPTEQEDVRLVAYVVARAGHSLQDSVVLTAVSKTLPGYMVPSVVVTLDELPVTSTGKVDARSLPLPEMQTRQTSETYVAPIDSLERVLVRIWEECLQVTPVGTHDKFLALGGSSLTALQVFRRIEVELGKKLPLNVMMEAETITELAQEIRREDYPPPWPSLVPLQAGGSLPPLYCVHGLGGHVMIYHQFASLLGPDQPVYGLRAQGLDGVTPPLISIEEMATQYVREIRTFQPEGPYYLSGFSLGGKIAFEMACQLQAQGAQIALVAPLDATVTPLLPGSRGEPSSFDDVKAESRAASHWQEIRKRSLPAGFLYLMRLIGRLWRFQVVKRIQRLTGRPAEIDDPSISPERRVKIAADSAAKRYKFKPYQGSVVLFRTEQMKMERADPVPVWQGWVSGSVDLIEIPGDHETMLHSPHVEVFANKMTDLLDEIHAQAHL